VILIFTACKVASITDNHHRMTEEIINDIEKRAVAIGCSMAALLADAGLDESTWWRWRHGKSSPTIKSLVKVQNAMKARETA
jgi:transcriptional regulator with XRE-family HTH domain